MALTYTDSIMYNLKIEIKIIFPMRLAPKSTQKSLPDSARDSDRSARFRNSSDTANYQYIYTSRIPNFYNLHHVAVNTIVIFMEGKLIKN